MHKPRPSTITSTAMLCAITLLFGCDLARSEERAEVAAELAEQAATIALETSKALRRHRAEFKLARGGFTAGTTSTIDTITSTGGVIPLDTHAAPFGHYFDVPKRLEITIGGGPPSIELEEGVTTIHGKVRLEELEVSGALLVRGQEAIGARWMAAELAPAAFFGGLLGSVLIFAGVATARRIAYRAYLARQAGRNGPDGGAFRTNSTGPGGPFEDHREDLMRDPVRRTVVADPARPGAPPPTSTPSAGRKVEE